MTQIALITGANRGLGLATARRLARLGATVLIGSRDPDAGERAAATLRDEGLAVESVVLDVTDRDSIAAVARSIEERHGRLDVLINNAGILPEATTQTDGPLNTELFEQTYETNVLGVVRVTEVLLPLLRRSDAGRIVNVSSTMGSLNDQTDPDSPFYGMVVPAYQSSKAALNGITIALSKALASTSIVVNSVCPGFVQTDLTPVNRDQAPTTAEDASVIVAQMAHPDGAPTGQFVDQKGLVAW